MTSIKHCYVELLHLTQLFLLREHSLKEVKMVHPSLFSFFQRKMSPSAVLSAEKKTRQPLSVPSLPTQNMQPPARVIPIPPSVDPRSLEPPPKPLVESLPPPQPKPLATECQPSTSQNKVNKEKDFRLEPLTSPVSSYDYRELWKICQTLFPEWGLCETIPNDVVAQKNKNVWLSDQIIPSIMILAFHDEEKSLTFLKNIAQAISLHLAPAKVISIFKLEKENCLESVFSSSHLRLIIACDYELYLHPKLMKFYREEPQRGKHFLHQIPLLLLSDLSLYLKEPLLKPLLWRAICNEFSASQRS